MRCNLLTTGRAWEIAESTPTSKVSLKLDFVKPFEAHNTSEYSLQSQGDTTQVTWAMHGNNGFVQKLVSVFVSMDSMVGPDFEAGLAKMKSTAES